MSSEQTAGGRDVISELRGSECRRATGSLPQRLPAALERVAESILAAIPDAVLVIDQDSMVVMATPQTTRALGYRPDEQGVRRVICESLRRLGYRVLEAGDGPEALERLADAGETVDLFVVDIIMPRMGGLEFAERLWRFSPEPRVLFVTGYAGGAFPGRSVLATGAAVLQKPFTPQALARRVREVLGAES